MITPTGPSVEMPFAGKVDGVHTTHDVDVVNMPLRGSDQPNRQTSIETPPVLAALTARVDMQATVIATTSPTGSTPRLRRVLDWSSRGPSTFRKPMPYRALKDPAVTRKDEVVADDNLTVELSMTELREITGYAVACAEPALTIFERDFTDDPRPRAVLDEARRFAAGGKRTKALRVTSLDAHRAAGTAQEMEREAAADAARAAGHAGAAAYLHPLAEATQVKHILGSAAHAARAIELDAGDDPNVGADYIAKARGLASGSAWNYIGVS